MAPILSALDVPAAAAEGFVGLSIEDVFEPVEADPFEEEGIETVWSTFCS
jgi:hypothetical protein